ncbi:MAG: hypothetical protein DI538_14980 [Azospira oryzae]|nr:MAG: hypothetical protein DI538_14980 [Azospira oryzae]
MSYQKKLNRYLNLGHTPTLPYALQYFDVLYQVVKLPTIRGTKYNKFQQTILGFHSGQVYSKEEYQRIEFEKFSPIERENYLPIAMWLLEQWPSRFTEICKSVSLSSAFIIKDFNKIPYWFEKEVFEKLYHPNPIKSLFPD